MLDFHTSSRLLAVYVVLPLVSADGDLLLQAVLVLGVPDSVSALRVAVDLSSLEHTGRMIPKLDLGSERWWLLHPLLSPWQSEMERQISGSAARS